MTMTYAQWTWIRRALLSCLVVGAAGGAANALNWTTSYDNAAAESKRTGKPILAFFTGSDWCGWCSRLQNEVFKQPQFGTWAEKLVLLELDYPKYKPLPPALLGQNARLKTKYGITGYPTILFLDADGRVLGRSGYVEPPGPDHWIRYAEQQIGAHLRAVKPPTDPAAPAAPAASPPGGTPNQLRDDLAIYLGCGDAQGPGMLLQLDGAGKVIATVAVPSAPAALALHPAGLIAALPRTQQVVKVLPTGQVETLLHDTALAPSPVAVAVNPKTGDVLVGDNQTDDLILIPAAEPTKPRKVFHIPGVDPAVRQNLRLAVTPDGAALLSTDQPAAAVYRVPLDGAAALGQPLFALDGPLAVDPTTPRWAAALKDHLAIVQDGREAASVAYPKGRTMRHAAVAFGPDGSLLVAPLLAEGPNHQVMQADLAAGSFRVLLTWGQSPVLSLAVGPKVPWKASPAPVP
jgi:thioredoxin-related protein